MVIEVLGQGQLVHLDTSLELAHNPGRVVMDYMGQLEVVGCKDGILRQKTKQRNIYIVGEYLSAVSRCEQNFFHFIGVDSVTR